MKRTNEEIRKDHRSLCATYHRFWGSPDGQIILEDLMKMFNGNTLRVDKEGRTDPYGSIAAAGAREHLLYIEGMRKQHEPVD